ncbi:aldehyde dehydrogenase family protein [Candidatus Saccharibacteria bacterium]|nr:aldehyde dehydrogenase family protein [Candidatus Saccharibacteria bacterium]MCB9834495.1 aldehyde dehydrogenase family protein [Candidatus Nomurabacteria bacterium]
MSQQIISSKSELEQAVKSSIILKSGTLDQYQIVNRRFIVDIEYYDDFLAQLKQRLIELDYGNLRDRTRKVEVLSCQEELSQVDDKVKSSIDQGAKVLMGGQRMVGFDQYYLPTILYDTTPDMTCWKQEIKGPVFVVLKALADPV